VADNEKTIQCGVAIIGAGQAGVECAFTLRKLGYEGHIVILSNEHVPPYQRPPLSKTILNEGADEERVHIKAQELYEKERIELILGTEAISLDVQNKTIVTNCGGRIQFDKCVIATGVRSRELPGIKGALSIRTLRDARSLGAALKNGRHLLVLGGGYLGLEVASLAMSLGLSVTVVELASGLMHGRVSNYTAQRFKEMYEQAGAQIYCGRQLLSVERTEQGGWEAVVDGGLSIKADVFLAAIGAEPNVEFVTKSGIKTKGGIVVDAHCRTSVDNVYAVGDCTVGYYPELTSYIGVESVQNAIEQARIAAASIANAHVPHQKTFTFWSEQLGHRLQVAGFVNAQTQYEDIPTDTNRGWVVKRYFNGELKAIEAIDSPVEFIKAAKEIAQLKRASDHSFFYG